MVDVDDDLVEGFGYEEIVHAAYPAFWKTWLEHPEYWDAISELNLVDPDKSVLETYERPWDFAIFLLDEEPIGDEIDSGAVLHSTFYFVQ